MGNERGQGFWSDSRMDEETVLVIQKLLADQEAIRKKRTKEVMIKPPTTEQTIQSQAATPATVVSLEDIRDALQARTGLDSLTAIDDSVGRVANFDKDHMTVLAGVTGIKEEVLKKFREAKAPQKS